MPTGPTVRAGGGQARHLWMFSLLLLALLFGPPAAAADWSVVEVGYGQLAAVGGDLAAWLGSDGQLRVLRLTTGQEWALAVPPESGGMRELAASSAGVAWIGQNQYLYLWRPEGGITLADTNAFGKQALAMAGDSIVWLDKRNGHLVVDGDWFGSIYHYDVVSRQNRCLVSASSYYAGDLASNGEVLMWTHYGSVTWQVYRGTLAGLLDGGVADAVYAAGTRLRPVPVGDYLAWADQGGIRLYRAGETRTVPGSAGATRPVSDGNLLAWEQEVDGVPQLFVYNVADDVPIQVTNYRSPVTVHSYTLRDGILVWSAGAEGVDRVWVAVNGSADQSPPNAPPDLQAAAIAADGVTLTWARASDDLMVTGYVISRDGTAVGRTGALVTSFADTGLAPGTGYTYAVTAEDAAGHCSPPASLQVTTAGVRVRVLAPGAVPEGSELTVTVAAYHAADLYAADISLCFDQGVLRLVEGGLSIAAPLNELILQQGYDNQAGTAAWVAGRSGQVSGVSGDVPLAELTFVAAAVGSGTITPTAVGLADSQGRTIPVSFEGATVTVCGASGLTGTLEAEGVGAVAGITVRLYDAAKTLVAEAATGADGRFEFADLPSGTYHLLASRPGCLTRFLGTFAAGAGEWVEVPPARLLWGDVDGNDRVDLSDLVALGLAYRRAFGDPGFNAAADFDANGQINLSDFVLLAHSYGLAGDTLP